MTYTHDFVPDLAAGLRRVRVERLPQCQGGNHCTADARFDARILGMGWGYFCPDHALSGKVKVGTGCGQLLLTPDEEVPDWARTGRA